ncbi:MAG: hypothetical protein E6861_12815, partial [Stenotrophomonas maltophilia]|nr:hypothetical protein [Stenotrophomonas maltophilia]
LPLLFQQVDRAHSIQTLEIECDLPGAAGWDRRETPLRHGNQGCALISSIVDPPPVQRFKL